MLWRQLGPGAEIKQFIDPRTGQLDFTEFRHYLAARCITDHCGVENSISSRELCQIYFGYVDMETLMFISDQMQIVRLDLMHAPEPIIVRSHRYRWYVAATMEEARGFISERAKRFVRAHRRLEEASDIGQKTYALPASDPLVRAIEGAQPTVEKIEEARKQLPPAEDKFQDNKP